MPRIGALVLVIALACGCASETATVRGVIQVTDDFESGAATRALAFGDGLEVNMEMASFTPISMRMQIVEVLLFQDDMFQQIRLPVPGGQTEFMGLSPLESVLDSEATVEEEDFGTYTVVRIGFGDPVTVSGAPTVNGLEYAFTDGELSLPFPSWDIRLTSPVTVDAESSPVVSLLVDLEDSLRLIRLDSGPGDGPLHHLVDASTNAYVGFNYPVLLPYVGSEAPTVEQYQLTFETDAFGDNSKFHLRVDVVRDPAGAVVAVGWAPVYLDRYNPFERTDSRAFEPGMLTEQALTMIDGDTWRIADIKDDPGAADRAVTFEAFTLGDHTGTMSYGGTDYSYTAVRVP